MSIRLDTAMSIRLYVCLSEGNVVVTPKGQYLKTNRKRDIRSSVNTLHEGSSGLWLNVLNCQARFQLVTLEILPYMEPRSINRCILSIVVAKTYT